MANNNNIYNQPFGYGQKKSTTKSIGNLVSNYNYLDPTKPNYSFEQLTKTIQGVQKLGLEKNFTKNQTIRYQQLLSQHAKMTEQNKKSFYKKTALGYNVAALARGIGEGFDTIARNTRMGNTGKTNI